MFFVFAFFLSAILYIDFFFFLVADDEPKRDAKILKISEFIMLRNGNLFVFHFAACIHFGLCFFFSFALLNFSVLEFDSSSAALSVQ